MAFDMRQAHSAVEQQRQARKIAGLQAMQQSVQAHPDYDDRTLANERIAAMTPSEKREYWAQRKIEWTELRRQRTAAQAEYDRTWIATRGFGAFTRYKGRSGPHIYLLFYGETLQYIGQASSSVWDRLGCHRHTKDYNSVWVMKTPHDQLDTIERTLIRHFDPPLNRIKYRTV